MRIFRRLVILGLILLGAALAFGAPGVSVIFADEEPSCEANPAQCRDDYEHRNGKDGGNKGDGGEWRCEGVSPVTVLVPAGGDVCYLMTYYMDCSGNVVRSEPIGARQVPCGGAGTFWKYCVPGSGFSDNSGHCELRDFYGHRIVLRVTAPPHEFQARPYPVGFVAREDIFGIFHPTFRIRWIPPALGNKHGDYPTYADSEWRLWTWGGDQGPGSTSVFPCGMSEEDLMRHDVPAGTTCLRAQLWSAPSYDAALNPVLAPGLLLYPSRNLSVQLPPGEEVALSFPYASHPATRQTRNIRFGGMVLPAFPGYFQRWWYVRFRLETKVVEDVPDTRTVCRPTSSGAVRSGCYIIVNGRQIPGAWVTETYVARKRWKEGEKKDKILDLRDFGLAYSGLHPRRGIIRGPEGTFPTNVVIWRGACWLRIPIAVREGQGVVCANPGCTGLEPLIP
ncbi:MAG: hypothetical protein NZM16_12265 [Thermoflexus sp.]|uniref:hypothetical protein n=1 Tax=Thermoflexus sp. TaxID=1969742 RepID=UPI0025CC271F|nr:hypothetical protein [Thermoflexus sp.]MCS6964802.1 hypothetical protein [Thermoflexus sp.]